MSKVLIVEDDPGIRMSIEIRLTHDGHDVVTAADGATAFAAALREAPDLVLMDVSMPDDDGFAVAERLQGESATENVPVIFLTASRRPEFRTRAEELGAAGFFEKPYDAATLLSAVREVLSDR